MTNPPPTPTPAPATSPARITNHANGSTLRGTSVTFDWSAASGPNPVRYYSVYVGSTPPGDPCTPGSYCKEPGRDAFASTNIGSATGLSPSQTSATITGLPANGSTIYVRLFTKYQPESGVLAWRDYTYTSSP
ncbi:MAG TPA: hypothetical protein VM451_04960 [Candidatus Limnocylindria bacterium]|nr:hypothetical protein [Candidatus Limnocylindria bacterium]